VFPVGRLIRRVIRFFLLLCCGGSFSDYLCFESVNVCNYSPMFGGIVLILGFCFAGGLSF